MNTNQHERTKLICVYMGKSASYFIRVNSCQFVAKIFSR